MNLSSYLLLSSEIYFDIVILDCVIFLERFATLCPPQPLKEQAEEVQRRVNAVATTEEQEDSFTGAVRCQGGGVHLFPKSCICEIYLENLRGAY